MSALERFFAGEGSARVLVYGDVMLDRYWFGDCHRLSPEAPVPVMKLDRVESRPGGAANVAFNVCALGLPATLMGWIGDDAEGRELRHLVTDFGVEDEFAVSPAWPTITKLRVLGQNQQLLRVDVEQPLLLTESQMEQVVAHFEHCLRGARAVVLSDYGKGALRHARLLIEAARRLDIPVWVDPKSADFSVYAGATVITPNWKEFLAAVGAVSDEEEAIVKARRLMAQYDIGSILITRGKEGMLYVMRDQVVMRVAAAREVFDVTGAGDTVIAVMAALAACGVPIVDAMELANVAAGVVVGKIGAATVTREELCAAWHRLLGTYTVLEHGVSEAHLLQAVNAARARGERIVMTNGCFDILHPGHVAYLTEARAMGDRLIVAVNDDASVQRLKGPTRPFNALSARMAVLAGLRVVDWVVPFSEDTPARLIELIAPDILVKGGDYHVEMIAGADSVLARGGRVEIVPLVEGYSTTKLAAKMTA
ncbi:MAG: bifunctional heptose 7-phosphate kinase/heptose 1-phosphate adenyltransferase [Gammaproteobacteria bacterium RIFCSPHIGHO2_12_FULL_45_9]|nr:MAG: bifunctional heptose 7-phosphate kinase/heptose 1-phosphate adenyltransferase [Gammaproteobacteria bacterium RIFCSPHIGHO2_12_FULL_45_9]